MTSETTRTATSTAAGYVPCDARDVPGNVRFDVPGRNQGQIVEVAYGTTGRAEAGHGDPFMRVHDASDRTVGYYRWVRAEVDPGLLAAARRLARKHKAAAAAPGSFGDLMDAVGLDRGDYRRFGHLLGPGENPSAFLALAWVEAGRPEVVRR